MVESKLNDNTIELSDEVEGDVVGTKNYRFSKIGEPVPINSDADSVFDPQSPPYQPLAISERHNLIFVAHSTGFCVARTKDVIEFAKTGKSGSSIQQLSVVDVSIGKVSILALSSDSLSLAAIIDNDIDFFDVARLLKQDQKSYFSVSLSDSICIKDMRWTTKFEKNYLVLSSDGKLYYGVDKEPLKDVMDNVDAVEWSVKGKLLAVSKKTVLSILSSKFKEKLSISLLLKSLTDDSDAKSTIKVDSIKWVRRDCIIVGCFQVTADGNEESYFVQVITSKEGDFTKVSNPIVQVFSDTFLAMSDEVVPFASGPHMFLNYLEQHKLAFAANRKIVDQHIVLFGWGLNDNKNEAATIEILDDAWFPRIESQENGDDNLILGICADKVSQDESIKLTLGDEEREVSPCCILMCITIDAKLSMFHFFSAENPPIYSSNASDAEEEDSPPTGSTVEELDKIPSSDLSSESSSLNIQTIKVDDAKPKAHTEKSNQDRDSPKNLFEQQGSNSQSAFAMTGFKNFGNLDTPKVSEAQSGNMPNQSIQTSSQISFPSFQKPAQSAPAVKSTLSETNSDKNSSSLTGFGSAQQSTFSKIGTKKVVEAQSGDKTASGNFLTYTQNQSTRPSTQMGFSNFQSLTPPAHSSLAFKPTISETVNDKKSSSFSISGSAQVNQNRQIMSDKNLVTGHSPGSPYQNPFLSKLAATSPVVGLTKIQPSPAVHSSQSSFQGNITPGRTSGFKPNSRTLSPSETSTSKQSPNFQGLQMVESKPNDNIIELSDEVEGDVVGTKNYRFSKIGEPVPINSDADSVFDPQSPPYQPLAISERHNLIFVAHSTGFCVARTKDVIEFAKTGKSGSSIQQLSVVDVSIGKVSILALSSDSLSLAAIIDNDIDFFDVARLLKQDQKPYFSVSLSDSICIKDMRWTTKFEKNYLVLSSDGKLYYGVDKEPLKHVMDNVDAVEWSVKGKLLAVAKKTVLSILSSKFSEKLSISLLLKSLTDDSDANSTIKVDSIKWVRRNCIIVGCFQVTTDGNEECYFVQVITSEEGNFTKVSNPIVQVFSDAFLAMSDEVVPFASGPHMFLNYLEQHKLAFAANRKIVDQHIVLFGWGLNDNKNEAATIEILDDAWFPRIESQENGDDNLILGICADKVSQDESIKLSLGDEEREVSPCCILMCITIDAKLTMFHFFSAENPPIYSSNASDAEEEDSPPTDSTVEELDKIPSSDLSSESSSLNIQTIKVDDAKPKAHTEKSNQDRDSPKNLFEQQGSNSQSAFAMTGFKNFGNLDTPKVSEAQSGNMPNQSIQTSSQISFPSFQKPAQSAPAVNSTLSETNSDKNSSSLTGFGSAQQSNFSKIGTQKVVEAQSGDKTASGNFLTYTQNQSTRPSTQMGFSNFQSLTPPAHSSLAFKPTISETSNDKKSSSFSISGSAQVNQNRQIMSDKNLVTGHSPGSPYQNPFLSKLPATSPAVGLTKIQPSPAVHRSQSSFQGNITPGRTSGFKPNSRTLSPSETSTSKQSPNVEEMAKELDRLLGCIEGSGGYKDTSITFQTESVLALEAGLSDLSQKCRTWAALMDERLGTIQLLHDNTVQVLAKKVYMEGIVKQATESRYLELWNLQKLNPELELKQRHIAEVNQDLTNQLIELERHFNTLELNKFGENQPQMNRRHFSSKQGPSRSVQSLHSLRNTMNAQLSAAEQLSECLSKQMSVLKIDPNSSSKKKGNIKKELFETIGLSYDNSSFHSPGEKVKFGITASDESSLESNIKERSSKNYLSSAVKSSEPESVRRRRDSLDRNWANFEPPKTTVKRTFLKEDLQKASPNKLCLSVEKPRHTSAARTIDSNTKIFPFPPKNNVIQDSSRRDSFESASNISFKNVIQDSPRKDSFEIPSSTSFKWGENVQDSSYQLNDKLSAPPLSNSGLQLPSMVFDFNTKQGSSSSSVPMGVPTQTFGPLKISSDIPKESGSKSLFGNVKDQSFSFESGKSLKFPASPPPFESKSETKLKFSTSISSSSTPAVLDSSSLSSSASSTTSTTAPPQPPPTTTTLKSTSTLPPTSSPVFPSKQVPVSTTPPSTNVSSKSPSVSTELPISSKTDTNTTTEPQTTSVLKTEPIAPSLPATKPLFSGFGTNLTTTLGSNQEQQSTVPITSSASASASSTSSTIPSFDVAITQDEDGMDEEAPEMNQSTQLSLGNNLGSLGLGSTVSKASPTSNPFGGSFSNNSTQPSSQFTNMTNMTNMTNPGGQLFRPASFSFPSSQPAQQTSFNAFSGGFGQPQPAAASAGIGQQALGSVLGSFGQSRQFGSIASPAGGFGGSPGSGGGFSNAAAAGGGFASLASVPPGSGFAAAAAGGGGFAAAATGGGGFAAAATGGGGGFGSAATPGGGFGSVATPGGGFGSAATPGGGFGSAATPGGGFGGAASGSGFGSAGGGGGFGGFGNQQSGGFSGFGGSGGGTARPPSELFTQIRK